MNLENMDKNLLIETALMLNLKDILSLCRTNKKFNDLICNSNIFWINKIKKDYNFITSEEGKEKYKIIKKYNFEVAAEKGYLDLVKYFLKLNPKNYEIILESAIKANQKDIIEYIFKKYHKFDYNKLTFISIMENHEDLVNYFISKGGNDWNKFLFAASQTGNKKLVDYFISKGADNWNQALLGASIGNHKELIDYFIKQGADEYINPLIAAASSGNIELIEFFLSKMNKHSVGTAISIAQFFAKQNKQNDVLIYLKTIDL
jgi:ankyrin repeat protein